tara:strand:+ start:9460 stop:10545 length:1086 start_codon:yes stop_codon:yes gene_type:complete
MIKIAIVGAGNAGCVTALHFQKYLSEKTDKFEIDIYHSPHYHPIEKVGQGTTIQIPKLISSVLDINWYHNPIGATIKTGILYENWGKKNDKIFHSFEIPNASMHFVPKKLSECVIESKLFNVIEKVINEAEEDIDADIIFDCRGRHNRDHSKYDTLINPLNSVLLSAKYERDIDLIYTRCVATPNGWTFVIPNQNSVSYGYLYNNQITKKEDAIDDFTTRFHLDFITDSLNFDNYMAKSFYNGSRTILQGNMYGFIEPMEATSVAFYQYLCRQSWDFIFDIQTFNYCNDKIRTNMKQLETMILWHYQYGSKYDTPFWDYAKSLPFNPDDKFYEMISNEENDPKLYGQWKKWDFDNWKLGVE